MSFSRGWSRSKKKTKETTPVPTNVQSVWHALEPPETFPFPAGKTPYTIQEGFMKSMYLAIEKGGIGVFESPTGTGKSWSIICAGVQWLRDHQRRTVQTRVFESDAKDWLTAAAQKMALRREEDAAKVTIQERELARTKLMERLARSGRVEKKVMDLLPQKRAMEIPDVPLPSEDGFMIASGRRSPPEPVETPFQECTLFYASRTHSQLRQFVESLQSAPFEDIRVVTLGSRMQLCVHDPVRKNSVSLHQLNDRCQDLRNSAKGCPCKTKEKVQSLADSFLATVSPLEDMESMGKKQGACPYYASRKAIAEAEIVALPYSMLFHEKTRESLGLCLQGAVVVVDEAHNLIEAMNGMYGVEWSLAEMNAAHEQLSRYMQHYKERIGPDKKVNVQKLVLYAQKVARYVQKLDQGADFLVSVHAFETECVAVDAFDIFEMDSFVQESDLARKVSGFVEWTWRKEHPEEPCPHRHAIRAFVRFLVALQNHADGRIIVQPTSNKVQYVLLEPSTVFERLYQTHKPRAIVLAGGTMKPQGALQRAMFPSLSPVHSFSCGHVVPAHHVQCVVVSQWMQTRFRFSQAAMKGNAMMEALKALLPTVLAHTPVASGTVLFFPSYRVLKRFQAVVDPSAYAHSLGGPNVFIESQGDTTSNPFEQHCTALKKGQKSLLCSVMGGKLSEGIDFADALARCVIVVGQPYPPPDDPVLLELKKRFSAEAYQDHYHAIASRKVNQSIGRSIRHPKDYATTLLVDERFASDTWKKALPVWMGTPNVVPGEQVASRLQQFFAKHT